MVKYDNLTDPREIRLAKEHELLDELCNSTDKISYKITNQPNKRKPPEGYLISYRVKTIIGINADNSPIYNDPENGDTVDVSIDFPAEYPDLSQGGPKCYAKTTVFHPNILHYRIPKGKICTNQPALGAWQTLDMLVHMIGNILQYKNYLAENKPPYPEDEKVAKWVREYAEPKGIIKSGGEKPVDNTSLINKGVQTPKKQVFEPSIEDLMDFTPRTKSTSKGSIDIDFDTPSNNNPSIDLDFDFKKR